ncbi:MAG TPA: helix-turn-helix domain-containing protein [Thermoplasmata archaeon]|nr:helix-turn-helix domain-containing protein [Thermoplasmata archaeon]
MIAPTETDVDPALLEQLRAFAALDNPLRLRAFLAIHDSPGISFNEIAALLDAETGLAAYHVGILKAADLVEVSYARSGRATSSYRLSEWGKAIRETIFGALARSARSRLPRRPASGRGRVARPTR